MPANYVGGEESKEGPDTAFATTASEKDTSRKAAHATEATGSKGKGGKDSKGGRPQPALNPRPNDAKDSTSSDGKAAGACNICGQDCRFKGKVQKLIADGKITYVTTVTVLLEEAKSREPGPILGGYDVLLDIEANVSVFWNSDLLDNIRSTSPLEITGVGPTALLCDQVGDFGVFGTVYFNPTARANILCFDEVADMYEILWDQEAKDFTVVIPAGDFSFKRRNKLYVWATCDPPMTLLSMVTDYTR